MAKYGESEHQEAFEVYRRSRSFYAVAKALKVSFHTAKKWASPSFSCPDGCNFHDYGSLLTKVRRRVRRSRVRSAAKRVAQRTGYAKKKRKARRPTEAEVVDEFAKEDEARLNDLSHIWNRVMQDVTGRDRKEINDPDRLGLRVGDLAEAVNVLQKVVELERLLGGKPTSITEEFVSIGELRDRGEDLDREPDPDGD